MAFRYRLKAGMTSDSVPVLRGLLQLVTGERAATRTSAAVRAGTGAGVWGASGEASTRCVQERALAPALALANATLGESLQDAVRRYQRRERLLDRRRGDLAAGLVNLRTWARLAHQAGRLLTDAEIERLPAWVRNLARPTRAKPRLLQTALAQQMYAQEFPWGRARDASRETQAADMARLLDLLTADSDIGDVRHAAYVMATAMLETGYRFAPVNEDERSVAQHGNRQSQPVAKRYALYRGAAGDVLSLDGMPPTPPAVGRRYHGRGYCQLTHYDNYAKFAMRLALPALLTEPDLALEPETAYRIMSVGVREGRFTGHRLADFETMSGFDYRGARSIVNGDAARETPDFGGTTVRVGDLFAEYCETWEAILLACR